MLELHKRVYVHVGARDRQRKGVGGQPESRISPATPHRFLEFLRKGEEEKRAASKYGNQNTNVRLRLTLFGRVCALLWVPIDVIYQQPRPIYSPDHVHQRESPP